ncbi:MAG: tRNA (guanosine(37)-N1)-methyltransferase TrmD [bacterium]|nr:tRNA (guanosine(37)-N1)-methyltransferase TrmD [bacterium]
MKINILTIFPKLFDSFLNETLIKKAITAKLLEINVVDIRAYATDKHHITDEPPYGGGPGMVMKIEPIFRALEALKKTGKTALMSPRGRQFSQSVVEEYAKLDELTLICGRYEGVDYRVTEHLVDEELSIGPYVMSGGEVPAMVVAEAVSRYVPGVLGNSESLIEETFSLGGRSQGTGDRRVDPLPSTLYPVPSSEYPCYTKPEEFNGWKVPEVLLSGNHALIKKWREENTR